jgi:hypothetical protein
MISSTRGCSAVESGAYNPFVAAKQGLTSVVKYGKKLSRNPV